MAKYKSRATRASECASGLRDVAEKLREINWRKQDVATQVEKAVEGLDLSEIESLAEEMRSWEENIQEKFSATQKYEEVSDAADALEAIDVCMDMEIDCKQAAEEWADQLDIIAAELEDVQFPGMY